MTQEKLLDDVFSADIVGGALKCNSPAGERLIDLGDILCALPSRKSNDSGYTVLFFQRSEIESKQQDLARLMKIKIATLPTPLSHLLTDLPDHLRGQGSPIQVVISTRSGTGRAKAVFLKAVQPLLAYLGLDDYEVHETESAQTIIELAQSQFLERACNGVPQTIILLAGDGGVIDIVDVFYKSGRAIRMPPKIALIPCGTGNAMASSIGLRSGPLSGLTGLLWGKASTLPIFASKFSPGSQLVVDEGRQRAPIDGDSGAPSPIIYGAVVASWGLHAALVADSDTSEYRKYGSERFQMAAKELLYPSDGTETHRFKGQITLTTLDGQTGIQKQEALSETEHMYALATLVPRLEKEFLISPDSEPLSGEMRLIRFGPMSPEEAMHLMTLAYQGGRHVLEKSVTYAEVEGLRINFQEDQERWRRVCVDGKIIAVEKNGWMELCKEPRQLLDLMH
ncbi:ATP-NAD kinase PpnK-type [Penicillium alfredii]|uniref:ATP-NAD kinase PpnK-type n=1 Tax=Penicillium alfredii TaxID=1506179 RepID=A0A9W9KD47_9EURO|nr:ATP-NAD kinase PpnK-type [Penicillium alfredii]KAJ5101461.1 ATP-NAD kinase PpnK-type [Penicillium alfredii]